MDIGIVGCGAIGGFLASELERPLLNDRHPDRAEELAEAAGGEAVSDLGELARRSDLVVEAAAPSAVETVCGAALSEGCDVLVMSVSGLMDQGVRERVRELAEESDAAIYTPSGAICGLDGVKGASVKPVDAVDLTTRKPPEALKGAPGVQGMDLDLNEELEVFRGPAEEAVELFPRNVNVSAALSMAGVGPARTRVRIVADPSLDRNVHEVEVEGDFGSLFTRVENVPSPDNPKTSYLAALSALATIRGVESRIRIGT